MTGFYRPGPPSSTRQFPGLALAPAWPKNGKPDVGLPIREILDRTHYEIG